MEKKHYKASLTLEAALVLPVFMFALLSIISFLDMIRFHAAAEQVLENTGREIAVYGAAAKRLVLSQDAYESLSGNRLDIPGGILTTAYVREKLNDAFTQEDLKQAGWVEGQGGLSDVYTVLLTRSDMVDLVYTYKLEPAFNVFDVNGISLINRCRLRAWTGYAPGGETADGERLVYVTENGKVYHLTETCSHLDLSIIPASAEERNSLRNAYGRGYEPCALCAYRLLLGDEQIFVTAQGDCYHASLGCSGLKRMVKKVPFSQVQDMPACSRCGR